MVHKFKKPKIDKIRFLYVARINPVKGINEFLKIFKKIEFDLNCQLLVKQITIGIKKNLKH